MQITVILIVFIGIGLPFFSFLAGLYYVKKNQERENRINRVVTKSMEGPRDAASLLHRLVLSGILELENNNEIVEVCNRIEAQGEKNPIPDNCGLSSDDLKSFFTYVSLNQIDLSETSIQKVIQVYKDKRPLKSVA
ncbi:hypothetical protein JYT92_00260 [bacterium AH-315-L15]|nr:hypothetical protein [bacterium AH-315-L15]